MRFSPFEKEEALFHSLWNCDNIAHQTRRIFESRSLAQSVDSGLEFLDSLLIDPRYEAPRHLFEESCPLSRNTKHAPAPSSLLEIHWDHFHPHRTLSVPLRTPSLEILWKHSIIIRHSRSNISSSLQSEWLATLPTDHHRCLFWRLNFIVHRFLRSILSPRNCQIGKPTLSWLRFPSGIERWQFFMIN